MKTHRHKNKILFALWSLGLLAYILFAANQYCERFYGGSFFYVFTGQNKITEAEQEYLHKRGDLIYADTLDSFPAQLYNESLQGNEGLNTDIMNQLALEMGTTIHFLPIEWPDVFDTLESGQADFIQISYSEERNENYFLTEPLYYNKGIVLLRNDENKIDTIKQLKGRKLAGISGDYAIEILQEKVPGLDIQTYNSIAECAASLTGGQVDGIIADEQNMMYYVQQENMLQQYYILEEEVYTAEVVFAVQKSDETLGRILNKVVYKLQNSDILDKIQRKWFLQSVLEPAVTDKERMGWWIKYSLGIIFFFLLLFLFIQIRTKALVIDRTRELEQEKKRLNIILQSIPHHLFEIRSTGEFTLVNQEEKHPLPQQEIDFLKELDWKNMLLASEKQGYIQKDLQKGARWYRVTISGIDTTADYDNALMLVEDITLHQIQLKQNLQDSKMAAIGQLASGVSHELKNPLEIICNYCYALKKGILHTEEQIQNTVKIIEDEAKSANKIVDNLLSFARITPEQVELTEVKPFLQMILKLQTNLMKKRKIQAKFTCADGIFIQCNPEGLKRIFINLIRNAQDAMPEGGTLTIAVEQSFDMVSIEIRDTGNGMSEETQEQIFNPFYTTKSTGTGLGLYLVYHQVQESHGTIDVSSQEGIGTIFRLTFPGISEE